jgi:CubicO group peptidase (beta-lactamase class C family)
VKVAIGRLALLLVLATGIANGAHAQAPRAGTRAKVAAPVDSARLAAAYAGAARLPRLRSLLVQHRGRLAGERYWRGGARDRRANIKSASKSIISTLVGVAIAEGKIRDTDQTIGELLPAETRGLDADKRAITVGDLLSMRSGLQSTSFGSYGAWVSSGNWVRDALRRPMVAPRGGPMLYSTGSTHLLSAILTRATGMSTYRYAETRLARPLGIALRPWQRDPQGIYFGGNEMYLTPREMLKVGTLYLRGGLAPNGRRVLPQAWIDSSAVPRTISPFNGNRYGYGWWIREAAGHRVLYAWGYGGQFIFVVPTLDLVVVTTSDPGAATRDGGHLDAIYTLLEEEIVPAVAAAR